MPQKLYNIVRYYKNTNRRDIIATGQTLEEAQTHCKRKDTQKEGVWFDGFTRC